MNYFVELQLYIRIYICILSHILSYKFLKYTTL